MIIIIISALVVIGVFIMTFIYFHSCRNGYHKFQANYTKIVHPSTYDGQHDIPCWYCKGNIFLPSNFVIPCSTCNGSGYQVFYNSKKLSELNRKVENIYINHVCIRCGKVSN